MGKEPVVCGCCGSDKSGHFVESIPDEGTVVVSRCKVCGDVIDIIWLDDKNYGWNVRPYLPEDEEEPSPYGNLP